MTDYELVFSYSKKIESVLSRKYGAKGSGLYEKALSIQDRLGREVMRHIEYIAKIRNRMAHQEDFELHHADRYRNAAESVLKAISEKERESGDKGTAGLSTKYVVSIAPIKMRYWVLFAFTMFVGNLVWLGLWSSYEETSISIFDAMDGVYSALYGVFTGNLDEAIKYLSSGGVWILLLNLFVVYCFVLTEKNKARHDANRFSILMGLAIFITVLALLDRVSLDEASLEAQYDSARLERIATEKEFERARKAVADFRAQFAEGKSIGISSPLIEVGDVSFGFKKGHIGEEPVIKAAITNLSGKTLSSVTFFGSLYIDGALDPAASSDSLNVPFGDRGLMNGATMHVDVNLDFGGYRWSTPDIRNARTRQLVLGVAKARDGSYNGIQAASVLPAALEERMRKELEVASERLMVIGKKLNEAKAVPSWIKVW